MGYFSQLLEWHSSVYRWRLALSTRIPPFSSQQLEAACRVLADTERGLRGTQIGYLLQDIRVPDADANYTKWKRLFNALAQMQNQHQVGNHLILFINRAMNPKPSFFESSEGSMNSGSRVQNRIGTKRSLALALECVGLELGCVGVRVVAVSKFNSAIILNALSRS